VLMGDRTHDRTFVLEHAVDRDRTVSVHKEVIVVAHFDHHVKARCSSALHPQVLIWRVFSGARKSHSLDAADELAAHRVLQQCAQVWPMCSAHKCNSTL